MDLWRSETTVGTLNRFFLSLTPDIIDRLEKKLDEGYLENRIDEDYLEEVMGTFSYSPHLKKRKKQGTTREPSWRLRKRRRR